MVITRQSERAPSLLRAYIHTLEGKLEPREQAVLTTLEQERPAWSERFPQALNAARHGILERLVNAMLRENLFGMGERQIRIVGEKVRCEEGGRERSTEVVEASECQDQSQGQSQGQSQDPSCDTCDALISSDSELFHETLSTLAQQGWNAPEWCFLPLHGLHGDSSLLALPIIREYGYGRLELAARPLHLRRFGREPYTIRQLSHPVELLKLWRDEVIQSGDLPLDTLDAFAEEIADSTANLALALCGAQVRRKELQTEASAAGQTTLLDYLTARRRADDTFSPLVFLESWIIDGHPIHPGTKLKQGMATSDLLRFAPEFAATPDLEFVAVHHALLETQSIDELSMTERLYLEHPEVALAAETDLAKKGLSISDYHIVPVHPWQRRESLPVIYEAEMAADLIVPLQVQVPAQATLSFRTVVPGGVGLSHIKTAVNVVATSTVRTISPNSTHNGPRLSGILQEILRREEGFGGTLVFVSETAGCAFRLGQTVGGAGVGAEGDWGGDAPEVSDDEIRERKRRNLSAILRDNPETDLKPNELPVTASALTMQSPLTDVPFAVELIQRLQQQEGIAEETEAAHRWLQQYVEVALPGFLTLLSRYGIGLEGHQQNSIMVFHQGRPVRMIQRDFGGVRISRRRLEAQGLLPDLYPGSMTLVDDEDEMRGKLFHAVYQGQIGELILTLARHYGIDDRLFWRHVYTVSHRVFAELKQDPAIHDQAAEDETALFADKLSLKALTRMRLDLPCANRQYTLEKVPNPLVR